MKRRMNYPIFLTLLVIFGLILSYFLLYDIQGFERLIGIEQPENVQVGPTNNQLNQAVEPLETTTVRTADVVIPDEAYYRVNNQSHKLNSRRVLTTLSSLLESRPIIVEDLDTIENPGSVEYFYQVDHVQIVFPERLPIGLYNHIISLPDDEDTDVYVDRLFIPLIDEENNSVYIVDSENNRYIAGELSTNLTFRDIANVIEREDIEFAEVMRYQGASGPIYLPTGPKVVESHVFTLDVIPENIYINQVFQGATYNVSEISNTADFSSFRYQNFLYTLDNDRSNHRMSLTLNRLEQGSPRTVTEKIRNSLNALRSYSYWQGDFRIDHFVNNVVSYRQFYNGYPIHASSQLPDSPLPDYGRTTVQLRNDLSGDVYRINQTMINFGINIDNLSQPMEIAAGPEIIELLQDLGYPLSQFEDVFVGYEWMPDTENLRKVELHPNWIFKLGSSFYTMDDIQRESFETIWQRETGGDN